MAGSFFSTQTKDYPAALTNFESTSTHIFDPGTHIFDPGTAIFDPDRQICNALLHHLSSSTSLHYSLLCKPFVKPGSIIIPELVQPIHFATTALSKFVDRVVRLGDSSSLSVVLEVPLTASIFDSTVYGTAFLTFCPMTL